MRGPAFKPVPVGIAYSLSFEVISLVEVRLGFSPFLDLHLSIAFFGILQAGAQIQLFSWHPFPHVSLYPFSIFAVVASCEPAGPMRVTVGSPCNAILQLTESKPGGNCVGQSGDVAEHQAHGTRVSVGFRDDNSAMLGIVDVSEIWEVMGQRSHVTARRRRKSPSSMRHRSSPSVTNTTPE